MEDTTTIASTESTAPASLASVIENAHTEVTKDATETKTTESKTADDKSTKSGNTEEKKSEEHTEKKPDAKTSLTEEEQDHARLLFEALKNPASAQSVIKALAEQAGLIETKAQEKEVVKTITDLLKEQLGPEFDFIGEKLGPALEKIVPQLVEKQVQDLRQTEAQRAEAQLNNEINSAQEKLTETYSDFKDYESEMLKLMDDNMPGKRVPLEYLTDLYHIAKGRAGKVTEITKKAEGNKENNEKNRGNVGERVATGARATPSNVSEAPKQMDLKSAIAAAKAEIEKG